MKLNWYHFATKRGYIDVVFSYDWRKYRRRDAISIPWGPWSRTADKPYSGYTGIPITRLSTLLFRLELPPDLNKR